MRTSVKFFAVILSFLSLSISNVTNLNAQDDESPFSTGADLVSRYVWRGLNFGSSPSLQPFLKYSKGNYGIGAWGAYTTSINAPAQEMDLYAYYTISDIFTVTLTDYFFPTDGAANNYFEYNNDLTGHVFEGMVSFEGTEDLPLTVAAAINFYGTDNQSMYFEAGYSFKHIDAVLGFGNYAYTMTGDGGIEGVNLGITTSNEIKITDDYSLPVSGSLIVNPNTENVFLVLGVSF